MSGYLLSVYDGWSSVFYFFGCMGILWCIIFVNKSYKLNKYISNLYHFQSILCYKDPESHPFISKKEELYLKNELGQLSRTKNQPRTPFKCILSSKPVISLIIAQVY